MTGVKVLDFRVMLDGVLLDKIMLSAELFLFGTPIFPVSMVFSAEFVWHRAS